MVDDTDKDLGKILNEVSSNREESLDVLGLQSMTGENRRNPQSGTSEAERENQNLQSKILDAEMKTLHLYFNALTALLYALEARDEHSSGHSRRVAEIAAAIAKELGLPPTRGNKIATAGLVHDIGTIGLREGVLDKQGELTNEEYQHFISHCEIGEHILRPIVEDAEILDMVRHHHEHYNGKGHPDGLLGKRTTLPIEGFAITDAYTHIESNLTKDKTLSQNACILAVADAYDAMMSPRSHRDALSIEKVAEEISRGAGSQFDPEVTEALLRIADSLSSLYKNAGEKERQEATGNRPAMEANEQAEKETKLIAKERAKQEAEEARRAREAEKHAKKQAELEAKERAKQEAEKVEQAVKDNGSQVYEGNFSLLVLLADYSQLLNLKAYLKQIENIKIVLTRGSAEEDDISEIIDIFLKNPMPLIRILGEIPIVDKVHILGTEIVLTLKDPVVS